MREDLVGRIQNTALPVSRPLLPLFDAIINSIHAIDDRRSPTAGRVTIEVLRDETQARLSDDFDAEVRGFRVEDDGIGFDEVNRLSFDTADSRHKRERGSKGIGRFLWLKAFGRIEVRSSFRAAEGISQRTFAFRLPNGVEDEKVTAAPAVALETGTVVLLEGLQAPYRKTCPKSLDVLASRVIEHCLAFLLQPDCPRITIKDERTAVVINDRFREEDYVAGDPESFDVKGHPLSIRHLHVKTKGAKHRIHYFGNNREVDSEAPSAVDMTQQLPEPNGGTFAVVSFVTGPLLDSSVNQERTGFTLPRRDDGPFLADEVMLEDVKEATQQKVLAHAEPFLAPLREEKLQEIERYVKTEAPQYRSLLQRHRGELATIPRGLTPERLDIELHKIRARLEVDTKEKVSQLLAESPDGNYDDRLAQVVQQLNDVGKAALIQHVVHRRLVLDILAQHLRCRNEGKPGYYLEKDIHRIIFPMRATSDDVAFEDQNLWIIDEKLTFHRYLASDQPLNPVVDPERPDIVIWDNPFALNEEGAGVSLDAVTIIEFKRPQRTAYGPGDDPIRQVLGYVEKIKQDRALDHAGRPLTVQSTTPFYVFILCDLTEYIRKTAEDHSFIERPDRQGYFHFNPNRRAWIEIVSYDKVVDDARKRNRALFEYLGLSAAAPKDVPKG